MPRTDRTPQRSFAGGEQSPNLDARADLARWKTALATLENFVLLVQGGVTRRSGLRDVYEALASSTLIPFAYNESDGYAVEVSAGAFRFFRDFGFLESSPGVIYSLSNDLTSDEVEDIGFTQSADKLFITTGARNPAQLTRQSDGTFALADFPLKNGPFLEENADDSISLYTTASGELTKGTSFTLKARGGTPFQSGHVGSIWKLKVNDGANHGLWKPAWGSVVPNVVARWDVNTYKCLAVHNGKGGDEPPIHTYGSDWDGPDDGGDAAEWLYLHSGFGIVQVTGYTSTSQVQVTALTYVPDDVIGTSSSGGVWRWSEGAFSDVRGYPKLCALHKKRMYLARTTYQPTGLWASVIDDYPNFDASNEDADKGFSATLEADTGRVNVPVWMVSGKRLGIGTSGDEHVLDSATPGEPIQPDTFDVFPGTTEGSLDTRAINVDGPVFISKSGRRVHELGYDFQTDSFVSPDLTLLADHMAGDNGGQFLELAWQRDPYRLLWARRSDGTLACCTYRADQNINGWHRHPTVKGTVASICTVPAPSGTTFDLWAIVTRACLGGTSRRIECLMPFFEQGDQDVTEAFFADGGLFYDGAAHTEIDGFPDHLEGETLIALADGKVVRDLVVSGGAITLPFAASKVIAGLPMTSTLKTLRYDKDVEGALNGDRLRVSAAVVDVLRAAGIDVAAGNNPFELLMPSGGGTMDAAAALANGIQNIDALGGDWDGSGDITLRCTSPLPATIRAITPVTEVSN